MIRNSLQIISVLCAPAIFLSIPATLQARSSAGAGYLLPDVLNPSWKDPVAVDVSGTVDRIDLAIQLDNWIESELAIEGRSLPSISRWVLLPDRGKIDFDYRIDAEEPINSAGLGKLTAKDAVELGRAMNMRGRRIASMTIHPVRFDQQTSEYYRILSLSVRLKTLPERGENEIPQLPRKPSRGFDRLVDRLSVNPPGRDEPEQGYLPGGYLIVANENAPDEPIEEFKAWKQRAGHPVETLRFDEEIGLQGLKDRIRDRYGETGFEYLVIMGSDEGEDGLFVPMQRDFHDIYYAQLEGDDMLPDVAVGVFDCLDEDNLLCAVRRAISYQSAPYMEETDWYTRAGVGVGACSVPDDLSPSYTGKWVAEVLRRRDFDDISTSYFADNEVDDPSPMIEDLYNEGTNFILVRAHQWDFEADNVEESPVYPFHFLVSSGTISPDNRGAFNRAFRMGTADDMRGPSAGFGHYSSPRTNVANALAGGLIETMFLFDIGSYGWARNYAVGNLARVMVEDGIDLMPYYYSHWRYYGDPGQWCWNGVPKRAEIEELEALDVGATTLKVDVFGADNDRPMAGATVCLLQSDDFQLVTSTNSDGEAVFSWGSGELDEGILSVTVTGKDLLPVLETIEVGRREISTTIAEITWGDGDDGNDDGVPNPGERGELGFTFQNLSDERLHAMDRVSLESNSPWVRIPDQAGDIDALGGNEEVEPEPFDVDILHGCPDMVELVFQVLFQAEDAPSIKHGFSLRTAAPNLMVSRIDGRLNPGEQSDLTALLLNAGQMDGEPFEAALEAISPNTGIVRREAVYDVIEAGEIGRPRRPFRVRIAPETIPGSKVKFRLILTGEPLVLDTLNLEMPVGNPVPDDPFGPDGYGYVALENSDNDIPWADTPDFEWVEINPAEDEPDFEGELLDMALGDEEDTSVLIDLPFQFRYYGEGFDQITVCSNGWIAVGDQTSLKNQQNWVMPGFDGAFGMLAVFWDRIFLDGEIDGVFAYYDEDRGRYILQWTCSIQDRRESYPNVFEAILYDPAQWETVTGDSPILFQYREVNNLQDTWEANANCTIGISSPDGLDGLTYTYWNTYPRSCLPLQDGRAILWTPIRYEALEDERELTIDLRSGWNMISINVTPDEEMYRQGEERGPDMVLMMEQLRIDDEEHNLVLIKDDEGRFYAPGFDFINIPYWDLTRGYQTKVAADAEAVWRGEPIPADADLPVRPGWNIIAYYPTYQLDASAPDFYVLSPIIENVNRAVDENGRFLTTEFEFSNMPPWREGRGYQVLIDADEEVVLNYPPQREEMLPPELWNGEAVRPRWGTPERTGRNMSVLLTGIDYPNGVCVAAWGASGRLLGTGIVENNRCGMAVWGNDTSTDETDGAVENEALRFTIRDSRDGEVADLEVRSIICGRKTIYQTDGLLVAEVRAEPFVPERIRLADPCPNPFNSHVRLVYGLPEASPIRLTVYDLSGRVIDVLADRNTSAGTHRLMWDASEIAAGVYMLQLKAGSQRMMRKAVVVK